MGKKQKTSFTNFFSFLKISCNFLFLLSCFVKKLRNNNAIFYIIKNVLIHLRCGKGYYY